ncbi:efflux RND transporter periplasmic adaptor subunit [Stappia sp. GBMRC 2046]|uniref:Efflux RND transporter periplasmic adaptor subunit n=1 Tax=Stappia sediminis TaxID=2692190 RepID=A0A7X3LTM6_9HYPH|nr:efflux RND transporter periplasmic adaptor subunit [Stappia sediminis]MXN64910.1 efflux RND transporter periplasmic adaptor subunit [Stappia sediminis]
METNNRRDWMISIRGPALILICVPPLLAGCNESKPESKQPPKHVVQVAEAEAARVPLMRKFVGTTAAVKLVEIRAKVQGYLQERPFTEGADVRKGDVLFVIDQRPYHAEVEKFEADLEQDQARLKFAQQQLDRYGKLQKDSFASVQEYESAQSEALQAAGEVAASKAALRNARLDLEYTTITAPIDGRISNTEVNIGNLVSAENTLLTTLVQLDPLHVYFSPSEAIYQEMAPYHAKGPLKVSIKLASGAAYPHEGTIDFVDNQVDAGTGTIKMRAVIPNPDKTQRPGQYVEVSVTLADNHDAILVPAEAIAEDEAGHYLFVVGKDGMAERRNVKLGPAHESRYIVEEGVRAGEKVVIEGLQKIRGGEHVEIAKAPSAGAGKAQAAPAGEKPKAN